MIMLQVFKSVLDLKKQIFKSSKLMNPTSITTCYLLRECFQLIPLSSILGKRSALTQCFKSQKSTLISQFHLRSLLIFSLEFLNSPACPEASLSFKFQNQRSSQPSRQSMKSASANKGSQLVKYSMRKYLSWRRSLYMTHSKSDSLRKRCPRMGSRIRGM